MKRTEAIIENLRIRNEEITMWNTLPDITNLTWKRIATQSKDVNDHEHTALSADKTYLIYDTQSWKIGKFRRNAPHKGWRFTCPDTSKELAECIMIYELSGLPEIPKELIPRISYLESDEANRCQSCGECCGC